MFHKLKWFEQYKIQGAEAYPDAKLVRQCLFEAVFNQFLLAPLLTYFAYPSLVRIGMPMGGPLPPLAIILRDFVVFIVMNDTLHYWGHRALHHKAIYKYIHKQHHEFKIPIGISAKYAHIIEDIVANTIPTVIGPVIMRSHVYVFWLWLCIRLIETVDVHSGYCLPWSPYQLFPFQRSVARHDFHHSHNMGCYGSFTTFWDWITGTDQAFLEFQAKARAKVTSSSGTSAANAQKKVL